MFLVFIFISLSPASGGESVIEEITMIVFYSTINRVKFATMRT